MPTSRFFANCAPFPADIPVAGIPKLSLKKLYHGDDAESTRLFEACQEHGFFLLDLEGIEEGNQLLKDAEFMFDLISAMQGLGRDTLDQYAFDPPRSLLGYKSAGRQKTDDGKVDAMEMFTIGQDDMVGNSTPRQTPEPIDKQRIQCAQFFRHANRVIGTVAGQLDKSLGLSRGTLAGLCPVDKPSETSLRLLWSNPDAENNSRITLGGHTDIGMITLLFHIAGGLQILPAGSENTASNWRYIKPEPGCALINLGDTMVEWTGELLKSGLHRVMTAPGEQAKSVRQSMAYLVRPDRSQTMCRLRSSVIPPVEEGEKEDTRSVSDWAGERSLQILSGKLRPQTRGGRPVARL